MSLYELEDYRGAITAFDQLTQHAGNDTRMRDWGHIWSAQIMTCLASGGRALQLYGIVASSVDTQSMQFGQYDIGPVAARDWAKQRLESPFTQH